MTRASADNSRFVQLDVHDDTLESVCFTPARRRGEATRLRVTLFRAREKRLRSLEFIGCANVQFIVDADVLKDNSPHNTDRVGSSSNLKSIRQLMKRHRAVWGVTYANTVDPLRRKLVAAKQLVLFRVQFFGGRLEVVARSYRVRHLTVARADAQKAARRSA